MESFKTLNIYRVRFSNFWENMDFLKNLAAALLFTALITMGAKIRFYTPLTPVPFTLQTFFIFTASLYLRKKWVLFSTSLYILLGMIGIPVFAGNTAGISYLFGSTGGYLIAFLLVPPLISHIFRKYRYSAKSAFLGSVLGSILILLIGSLYLGIYLGNLQLGFILGFLPFIGIEIAKALGATGSAKLLFPQKSN